MPLLRYAMGDVGVIAPDPCPCGRRFRTLTLTHGRLNDSVVLVDGTRVFGDVFHLELPGIAEMYVRQDAAGAIHVYVVPDGTLAVDVVLADARRTIQSRVAVDLPMALHVSDRIPLTPGGKGQMVVSAYGPAREVNRTA
jgi:phenylacetate-CoA ligase